MFKGGLFLVLVVLMVMAVPVMAQDGGPVIEPETVLALTVADIVVLAVGLMGLFGGVLGTVVSFVRTPAGERSFKQLDTSIQERLDAARTQAEFMAGVEKLANGLTREFRLMLKDNAELMLAVAARTPVRADDALGKLFYEAVDGVPAADKEGAELAMLGDLRKELEALEKKQANVAYELTRPDK